MRQLILRDLEEEGWSHDSDDTPTNEGGGERGPPSAETLLKVAEERQPEEEAGPQEAEPPGFQVMRKGRRRASLNELNLKP